MDMQAAVMHACLMCTAAHPEERSQGCQRQRAVLMHMPAQPTLQWRSVWQEGDMLRIDLQRSTSCLLAARHGHTAVLAEAAQQALTFILSS